MPDGQGMRNPIQNAQSKAGMDGIRTIALIGKGNVATALGTAWQKRGIQILAFCNRSAILPAGFADENALLLSDVAQIPRHVDAILVAVSDDAVLETIRRLPEGPLAIHFSGCLPNPSRPGGVLWPIQSIISEVDESRKDYPMALSCSLDVRDKMLRFGQLIASEIHELNETERQTAHLTAVFAANFTNHCFAIAQELCQRASLSWDLFQPIAARIVEQGIAGTAGKNQTGPAIRNDDSVLDAHHQLLDQHPEFQPVYRALSASIQSFHSDSKQPKP
jgi:predicted short-subunit dehydrogenase-like oxidoreductase (DUF2520 family)